MKYANLIIGSWDVDFFFAEKDYDIEPVVYCLLDAGASDDIIHEVLKLMERCWYNCGFTFSRESDYRYINPKMHRAVMMIGLTSSGAEFIDTFVHEIHHLAVAIASELGADLDSEAPAYVAGDTAREFAEVFCEMGCECCRR